MSDYTGPGIYEILPSYATGMSMNLWGGDTAAGTPIKLYPRTGTENTLWEIVAAGGPQGKPETGDREYHILSVKAGLMVTNYGDYLKIEQAEVTNPSSRWKIRSAGNGNYYIDSADGKNGFNVSGTSSATGADFLCLGQGTNSNNQFRIKLPGNPA